MMSVEDDNKEQERKSDALETLKKEACVFFSSGAVCFGITLLAQGSLKNAFTAAAIGSLFVTASYIDCQMGAPRDYGP